MIVITQPLPTPSLPSDIAPQAVIYARDAMERALEDRDTSRREQSHAWLTALRSDGAERDRAITKLHAILMRAARFEVNPAAEPRSPTSAAKSSMTSPRRPPTMR